MPSDIAGSDLTLLDQRSVPPYAAHLPSELVAVGTWRLAQTKVHLLGSTATREKLSRHGDCTPQPWPAFR